MKSNGKGIFAIGIFVLAALFPFIADGATVTVDSVNAVAGTKFSLGVRMTGNTNTMSALTIPLEFNNQYLSVDSVSFAGSILPAAFRGVAEINNTKKSVRVSYIPNQFTSPIPTMNTAQGLIGTIYFSVAPGAVAGKVPIDSLYKDSVVSLGGINIHYWTRVEFSNQSGTSEYLPGFNAGSVNIQLSTGIDEENQLPFKFDLAQNFPNPFNPTTTIEYSLAKAGDISLKVYNVIGQEVATLVDGHRSAGVYSVNFDASNFPSGVYFYKYAYPEGSDTRKMLLVK